MNIVHILGNGFDINLGMKTRYADFYDYYKKIKSSSEILSPQKPGPGATGQNPTPPPKK